MRVIIVGPGAIGCLIAGFLTEAGICVQLLDNDAKRAETISQNGIRIESKSGMRKFMIPVFSDPRSMDGAADVVCLCVKAFDTAAAIQHAQPLVGSETAVVTLQNGLGNAEQISNFVHPDQIVCAVTGHGSTHLGPGHVRHAGQGKTLVAPFSATAQLHLETVLDLFGKSGIDTLRADNADRMMWRKLILNAAINPLTALWDISNGEVWSRPDLRQTALLAAEEARNVAEKKGVSCSFQNGLEVELEQICRQTAQNISSMLQDIRNKRKTEIEAISGAVVREAKTVEIPVPTNEMLYRRVLEIEEA